MPTIVRTLTVATIYWPSTLHTLSIGSLQQSPGRQYDHLHFINELMQLRKVICPRSPSWPPGSWDWNLGMADSAASLSRVQEGGGYEEVAGAEPDPFPFTPPTSATPPWAGKGRNKTGRHGCFLGPPGALGDQKPKALEEMLKASPAPWQVCARYGARTAPRKRVSFLQILVSKAESPRPKGVGLEASVASVCGWATCCPSRQKGPCLTLTIPRGPLCSPTVLSGNRSLAELYLCLIICVLTAPTGISSPCEQGPISLPGSRWPPGLQRAGPSTEPASALWVESASVAQAVPASSVGPVYTRSWTSPSQYCPRVLGESCRPLPGAWDVGPGLSS